jgi:hypothetical protein
MKRNGHIQGVFLIVCQGLSDELKRGSKWAIGWLLVSFTEFQKTGE